MEAATGTTAQSIFYVKLSSRPFFQCRSSLVVHQSPQKLGFRGLKLQSIGIKPCTQIRSDVGVVHASEGGGSASSNVAQGWLLEPVGDGDWRHIGQKSEMTVGRVPEKADLVIPVATVSALHARIQNKEGSLLVTDLDSTNGTFINEKRVSPGATAPVPPGSLLTFGDTHLAIFRVSKLEKAQETQEPAECTEGTEVGAQPETTS